VFKLQEMNHLLWLFVLFILIVRFFCDSTIRKIFIFICTETKESEIIAYALAKCRDYGRD